MFPTRPAAGQEPKPVALHGAAALDQLKQDGQYESLQAAMRQARFSVSRAEQTPLGRAAWHAPNPAAGYDAYVTEAGVSIAVNDESSVSLSLHSLGYGAAMQAVGPGEVSGDQQTINLMRDNGVREWYVNGSDGLEHGFTLAAPLPGARRPGAPLRLTLQVSAGWRAVASDDGKLVTLRGANGQAVEYGKLVVSDSLGRIIPARLTVAGPARLTVAGPARLMVADEQVVIEAEDHEAIYPLTIDPIFTLQQKLTAADGAANDFLGYAVALSGNTALVGAPYDDENGMEQGSAYVFVRNGATQGATWTQQARLVAQDRSGFDYFGYAVAIDGDTALVGAVYGPGSVSPEQGAVYVFVRGGTTWFQQARLNAGDGQGQDQFGAAVALDGDTALIGAFNHQISSTSGKTGAAYVFVRSGSAWTQQARLSANDGEADDQFGAAVALDGETALIGAPADNVGTNANQGSAYLFTRNGASWTQQQRLYHSLPAANDQFGNAVALSGEKALIGASLYESDDRGAVLTFKRGATGWIQTDTTFAPNPTAGGHFGVAVAMSGDTMVVGASRGLFAQGVDQRSAYVFVYDRDEWALVRQLGPEIGAANDGFGYAVALDGDTVLVGAYRGDAVATDQGAAYAFVLRDSRRVEQPKLTANDGAAGDSLGEAVALDGDTLVVGADGDDIGPNASQGSAYVFTRGFTPSGAVWIFQQKLIANDGAANDLFGEAVALSRDTIVVGAGSANIGTGVDQGSAYVFVRSGTAWTQQQKLTAIDGSPFAYFGGAVALGGDTVVVGADGDTIGANTSQGSAYVFTRNGTVWTQQPKLTANDGAAGDSFGYAVALSNDTVAVGAPEDTIGTNAGQGSAYVFTRTGTAWALQKKVTANDGTADDYFGGAVALDGDTLAVGAEGDKIGANVLQGSAYVFTRSGADWAQLPKLTASDGAAEDNFGRVIALSGDTLVVGASGDAIGANRQQGSAYVYTRFGSWVPQQKLIAGDGEEQDRFGGAVAVSGDTVMVGALNANIGANDNQGSVYVFVSPPCPPLAIAPASLPGGALGAAYNQQLTASGSGVGNYQFTVSSGALPPGLTLVSGTGVLSGSPTATGAYRFTITTTFLLSGCTGRRDYTITVTPSCPTIPINPASLPAGQGGAAYSQNLSAGGGAAPYIFAVTAGALPNGMSLSAAGLLFGAPTAFGAFNITVRATDANGCTGTRAYTLVINCQAITVNPATLPPGAAGAAYSQTITQTGGVGTATFNVSAGTLPAGLTLSSGGLLSGTPAQSGGFTFTVKATNANGCMGTREYVLNIGCPAITVNPTNPALPAGTAAQPYSQTFTATGGAAPHSFSVSDGTLPPGLSLSSGGALSGAATGFGTFNFTVRATAANGCAGARAYTLTINQPCGSITINPSSLPNATQGAAYNQTITATGGALPRTFSVSAGALPAGLNLSSSGALAGTPTQSGAFNFTIKATDANNCQGTRVYTLTVNPSCATITVNPASLPAGTVGAAYNQTITASGRVSPHTFSVSAGALPAGLNLSPGGVLSGAPAGAGSFNFTVRATDANGCQGTRSYALTINGGGGGVTSLQYYPLPRPIRLLDTRPGEQGCNAPGAPLAGGTDTLLQARGACGGLAIPANAQAVVGNATVVNFISGGGFITLYPKDAARPNASNLNFTANHIVPNSFTVGLGGDGAFNVFSSAATHFIVDITGYYAPPGQGGLYYHPLPAPVRLFDSRPGETACDAPGLPLADDGAKTVLARRSCLGATIPDSAKAIVGNATVVNFLSSGFRFITLYPSDTPLPNASNLNFTANQIVPNSFVVGLSGDGKFNIYAHGATHFIVDVTGYFSDQETDENGEGLLYNPLSSPVRLLDTRPGENACDAPGAPLGNDAVRTQTAHRTCSGVTIPSTAKVVVGNATVVNFLSSGFHWITLYPSGAPEPNASNLNFTANQIVPNAFVVGLSGDGKFNIYSHGATHFIVDVTGYYAP